jgi:hypothetical protein
MVLIPSKNREEQSSNQEEESYCGNQASTLLPSESEFLDAAEGVFMPISKRWMSFGDGIKTRKRGQRGGEIVSLDSYVNSIQHACREVLKGAFLKFVQLFIL